MLFERVRTAVLAVLMAVIVATAGCGGASSTTSASSTPIGVTATPPPSGGGTAAGTTISNIEQMSGWDSCDTCSGGGTVAFSMVQALDYPQPGSTQFSLGQGAPWAHALWWRRMGNDASISHFVLTLDQYMENPAASFGVEYEANQVIGGLWYDFAVECSFGYGVWQVWDGTAQRWAPTSVPCVRPDPKAHVQVRLEFARVNGQEVFVSVGTNGNIVPLNMAITPKATSWPNGDFGVHVQLNGNANPDPYSMWVHDLALTYW